MHFYCLGTKSCEALGGRQAHRQSLFWAGEPEELSRAMERKPAGLAPIAIAKNESSKQSMRFLSISIQRPLEKPLPSFSQSQEPKSALR